MSYDLGYHYEFAAGGNTLLQAEMKVRYIFQ
jgi:hypothetical protein